MGAGEDRPGRCCPTAPSGRRPTEPPQGAGPVQGTRPPASGSHPLFSEQSLVGHMTGQQGHHPGLQEPHFGKARVWQGRGGTASSPPSGPGQPLVARRAVPQTPYWPETGDKIGHFLETLPAND